MGLTHLEVDIANVADPDRSERLMFLVDSGALHSVVPRPVLVRLGIRSLAKQDFILANGEKIVRDKGGAVFRLDGHVGVADVVFGEEEDSTILGVTALEGLGLALDPLRRTLFSVPSPM